nr:helix-turn-helix domain-containing protein [Leucobacter luti]
MWRSTGGAVPAVLPADGAADLILRDDALLVAGPSTRAFTGRGSAEGETIGLRFALGAAAGSLRTEPAQLRDRHVAGADAVPGAVHAAGLALLRATRDRPRADYDPVAASQLAFGACAPPWAAAARRAAARGASAAALARGLGYSERQLQRHMLQHFGYGYAVLRRVVRAQHGQHLIRSGATLTAAAHGAGFSDQAHLTREFSALVGTTPAQFAAGQSAP